ncbi:MAG: MFS transporter [Burkholderiales bacterium]|nr:MFS transporter [Burkholderiales bacterium]
MPRSEGDEGSAFSQLADWSHDGKAIYAVRSRCEDGARPCASRCPGAVAVATAVNWGSAFLVSQFFLTLVGAIGISATFWLFALFCVAGGIFVWHLVPETKGRSLEQIQALWSGRGAPTISPAGVFR